MNVLFIGDIVGPAATHYVVEHLPGWRARHNVDLVVVNGENCDVTAPTPWQGFGMTVETVERLLAHGVDVITSGNHGWDGPDSATVHQHPRVLRPYNMPVGTTGKGVASLEVAGGVVTVLNLMGSTADPAALPVYAAWQAVEKPGTVLVDFHSDAAWEKMIFATAIDGEAAAVLGTHTHEPTIPLYILPGGTAYVTDVGMTAPTGSPGGFPLTHFATKYRGDAFDSLPPFTLSTGPIVLGAVQLQIQAGKTEAIRRIHSLEPEG
ncbi:MAG TPA: YmdB family metallophosphoesterase [Ardenticatenaceae bacterium]|nr:YmdB family metallophosphoesterase [Ardenticatenaceae bacterium]